MYGHPTRRLFLGSAITSSLGLVGCGTTGKALTPIKPVKFKLSSASVRWIENPGMSIRMSVTNYGGTAYITPEMQRGTALYIGRVTNLFRENAPRELRSALGVKGVSEGQSQIISLSPHSAFLSGAEIAYAVQVSVFDTISKESWVNVINVNSGTLVAGPNNNIPTVEYTKIFANTALSTFQEALMI